MVGLRAPLRSPPGLCNTYIPGSSTLDRFVWFIEYLGSQGFHVVIVNQFNQDPVFLESPTQWLQSWRWLMEKIQEGAPTALPRLIVDPVNEPEVGERPLELLWDCLSAFTCLVTMVCLLQTQNIDWEDNADLERPGLTTLYLEVMDMLFDLQPNLLYFVQARPAAVPSPPEQACQSLQL